MNIALILAGGSGQRMNQDIPKQFINVYGKPIIIYTLEAFEQHPDIDGIIVACLDGWQEMLMEYAKQFGITKLKWVANGGATGQESIRNGVYHLEGHCSEDDIVVVHDGIRPMVGEAVISDVIVKCKAHGNAAASLPVHDQFFRIKDELSSNEYIKRETLRRVQTPQAYTYSKLLRAYREAFEKNIGIFGSAYTNTMMIDLGETIYFAAGSAKNIKLTTADDVELFKSMLKRERENDQQ